MSEIATLHNPLMAYLRQQGVPFIRSRSDRESSTTPGDPDFVILRGRSCLCIEFKTEKGRLSKAQIDRHAELEKAGVKVHVCRDINAAVELVREWIRVTGPAEPQARSKGCTIRTIPGHGDFVMDQHGNQLRRATIEDLASYPKTNLSETRPNK